MQRKLDLRTGSPVWEAYRVPRIPTQRLTQDVRCDVLVVGLGISGAMLAEALTAEGLSVIGVDRRGAMLGSTAATTALVQFEIDQPLSELSRKIGVSDAEQAWRRSRLAVTNLRGRIDELGIDCGMAARSSLYLAGNALDSGELRKEAEARRSAGIRATYLKPAVLKEKFGIARKGAILSHDNIALSIRQMTESMVLRQGLDRKRIFITGLSAGGAMAAAMLASYPEVFAGGAIIAGLPYGSASTIPQAFDRMLGHGGPSPKALQRILRGASNHPGPWPRVSIWQGTADQTVAPSNADAVAAQWLGVHGFDEKTPAHPETGGRRAKRVWRNVTGEAMVEVNMIAGMGHGTPVGDGLGAAGPFMLDAGISSTREIARFWKIDATRTNGSTRSILKTAVGEGSPSHSSSPIAEKAVVKRPNPSRSRTHKRDSLGWRVLIHLSQPGRLRWHALI